MDTSIDGLINWFIGGLFSLINRINALIGWWTDLMISLINGLI